MFDAPFDAAIGSTAEPDTHYAPDAPDTRNGPPPPHAASRPLPLSELEARITELAGHLNAATHRWLLLVAEFDRREGWADGTTHSCAHWLGWSAGWRSAPPARRCASPARSKRCPRSARRWPAAS